MRLLSVKSPRDRGALVLGALQEECQLKNVSHVVHEDICITQAYIHDNETGPVLHELDKIGCGVAYGKISMAPVLLLKPLPKEEGRWLSILSDREGFRVRGRLAVEEMYDSISGGCSLSFDFCMMVILAAWIAAVGLATNNTVMIVASMLVSPLMGPILAGCFAIAIRDWVLLKRGILAELVGASLTIFWGLISGLCVSAWPTVAITNSWPTQEMMSRGDPSGLVAGAFFAVPSGAIVALCACAGGPTAIVGVAIAASLLPPLVNFGMNLSFAIAGAGSGRYKDPQGHDANVFYSISGISLALYAINVVAIVGVCLLFFYIKRVAPVRKQLSTYRDLPPAKHPDESTSKGGLRSDRDPPSIIAEEKSSQGGPASVAVELDTNALEFTVKEVTQKWKLKSSSP